MFDEILAFALSTEITNIFEVMSWYSQSTTEEEIVSILKERLPSWK